MVKNNREAKIAAVDRVDAASESSENSDAVTMVPRGKRGPYKFYNKKLVKTPAERKEARKEANRRYRENLRTDAAKKWKQRDKEFAALCFGP